MMSGCFRNPFVWTLLASFAAGGLWHSLPRDEIHREIEYSALPTSVKTRHHARPRPELGDPVGDYTIRCAKGISPQEIRWILEDFESAGLDLGARPTTREVYLELRRQQHHWYRAALTDGLAMTAEQSAQARDKLARYFERAKMEFLSGLNVGARPLAHYGTTWLDITGTGAIGLLISPDLWLFDPKARAMPWDLCDLSQAQEKITWKSWYDSRRTQDPHRFAGDSTFLLAEPTISANYGNPKPLMPLLLSANGILPFLSNQKFKPADNPLLTHRDASAVGLMTQIQSLHPAQLKILLLLQPAMAVQIRDALTSANL